MIKQLLLSIWLDDQPVHSDINQAYIVEHSSVFGHLDHSLLFNGENSGEWYQYKPKIWRKSNNVT